MDTPTQTWPVLGAMYRKALVSGLKIQDKMAPDMSLVHSVDMMLSIPVKKKGRLVRKGYQPGRLPPCLLRQSQGHIG